MCCLWLPACLLSKFLSGLLAKWKAVLQHLKFDRHVIVQGEGGGKGLLLSDKSFS